MTDTPVGSKQHRVTMTIHWYFTTDMTYREIGDRLGVSHQSVKRYIESPPAEEVRAQLAEQQAQVRIAAVEELHRQLREVGQQARDAEHPVEVWTDEDGNLNLIDVENEDNEVVKRFPVPEDFEMGADDETRFYRRREVREIIEQMVMLVGADEDPSLMIEGLFEHQHKHDYRSDPPGSNLSKKELRALDKLTGGVDGSDKD